MKESAASMTAMVVAMIREVHTRTARQPLIDDPWGKRLVPEAAVAAITQSVAAMGGGATAPGAGNVPDVDALLRASPAYANVVLRARYTEDALAAALARGVNQYVLVGAGFDSYALRLPEGAQNLRIYEIDHPATQEVKTRRLAELGISPDASLHFLPADLSRETLGQVLANSPFQFTEPAFFSLLGVTMYLSLEANRSTMREIANCGAPGSELVFTYVDQAAFAPAGSSDIPDEFYAVQANVNSLGEPFVSGFDPARLGENLRAVGLQLQEDLDDIQLIQRYDPEGQNGFQSSPISRIARVVVGS